MSEQLSPRAYSNTTGAISARHSHPESANIGTAARDATLAERAVAQLLTTNQIAEHLQKRLYSLGGRLSAAPPRNEGDPIQNGSPGGIIGTVLDHTTSLTKTLEESHALLSEIERIV